MVTSPSAPGYHFEVASSTTHNIDGHDPAADTDVEALDGRACRESRGQAEERDDGLIEVKGRGGRQGLRPHLANSSIFLPL